MAAISIQCILAAWAWHPLGRCRPLLLGHQHRAEGGFWRVGRHLGHANQLRAQQLERAARSLHLVLRVQRGVRQRGIMGVRQRGIMGVRQRGIMGVRQVRDGRQAEGHNG